MNRDAKAELNRRSQACEVLAGTGVRVEEKWKVESLAGVSPAGWPLLALPNQEEKTC